ncbi:MAG: AsmA family protein [Rhodospirillaceae bacterium]|nr:AsmA family protein [Rhodospirillaceae bacterium]
MKKLLIGIAVLLVVVIAALLIGPSFVNWNNHKADIIAAVRDATGRELAINGDISLRIIPAPALSVHDVRLAGLPDNDKGTDGDAAPLLHLKALEVRVALAPLISGEVQVTSVGLIEPRLVLEVLPDGRANWQFETAATGSGAQAGALSSGGAGNEAGLALSLDKLTVEKATVIYRDHRSGVAEKIENIELEGSASSLQGPFRFIGTAAARGLPLGFDLSLDALAGNKPVGVRLTLELAGDAAKAAFSGRVEGLETAPRLIGQLELSAGNVAAVHNALLKSGQAPPLLQQPLQLKAALEASAKAATLNDIDLTFGPLQGGGAVTATLGDSPSYDLALAISRLDLDRLLEGAGEADGKSGTSGSSEGDANGASAPGEALIPALPANLNGSVVVTVEGVRYRGGVVSQVQLDASAENGVLRLERLSALLPGGSDLRLSGDAQTQDGVPHFKGSVDLASNNLRGLLTWLDANPANIPAGRLANMVLTSDFTINPQQAQVTNMNLRLDSTTIEGAATVLLQSRPSFGLAMNIDRINLDGYLPDAAGTKGGRGKQSAADRKTEKKDKEAASPWAILETFDSNLILNVGELAYNAEPIKGLSVELGLAAGNLTVRKAIVRDLAGGNFSLSGGGEGFSGSPTGKARVRLRAKYIDGLARLAGLELPVPPKRLKGLTVDGDIAGGPNGVTFNIKTTLAGLKASLNGDASGLSGDPTADLKFSVNHASLAALSKTFDLGIKPLPRSDTPVDFSGHVKGGSGALDLDFTANLAGGEVRAKGSVLELTQTPKVDLTINAAHKDLVSLLACLGNKFPADQKSPGAVQLGSKVQGSGDRFDLRELKATVGALDLSGDVGVNLAGARPKLTANLQAGDVIVDHFLGAAAPVGPSQAGTGTARSQPKGRRGDERWSREAINLGALQSLDGDIKLAAKKLVFRRYPFEEPRLHLTLADGVLRVEDLTGRLFKGNVGLRATLNSRPLPGLGLSVQLRGADINQAMRTALQLDQVSGLLDFTGKFQAAGSSQWDLVNALSGKANVHAVNGVIRGFDMKNFSERLARLNKAPDFLNLVQRAFSGGETKYQRVDGTWNIRNGVAETQDMLAQLDASQATIKGKVRLPAWNMDLRAVLRLTDHSDAPDMGVHLYGPLDQPRHNVKTAQLERWLLARLGRELLGKSAKSKGLGKLLDAVTGGGRSSTQTQQQPTTSQSEQQQQQQQADPTQQLIQGLFKSLKKK